MGLVCARQTIALAPRRPDGLDADPAAWAAFGVLVVQQKLFQPAFLHGQALEILGALFLCQIP